MTSALWFALAIALGTLAADGARAGLKALRWRLAVRRSDRLVKLDRLQAAARRESKR